ncbi:MAG: hypothetical protein JNL79_17275 [Myxococcales bacterium]|nr:hypothetical protein [Myxococcales bacterium]
MLAGLVVLALAAPDAPVWVLRGAAGYSVQDVAVRYHGQAYTVGSNGPLLTVSLLREVRGSNVAARFGGVLEHRLGTSYSGVDYGFDAGEPHSVVNVFTPSIAGQARWVPGRFFLGLEGRFGLLLLRGTAGSGTSAATFAATRGVGMLRLDTGVWVGAERVWEIALSVGLAVAVTSPGDATLADAMLGVGHAF